MELEKGSAVQNYIIEDLLGEGGMGKIYLAREELTERRVAIKMLNPALVKDDEFVRRFVSEARILSGLLNPHIVALYNFFRYSGTFFMVLEFANGETLKSLIRKVGLLPEERSLKILSRIAAGLRYAHSKNVIHRDIKPSNIIVNNKDEIKITDFGIAKIMGDLSLTLAGTKLGTVLYMSPEQVLADKEIDHRSDIYSLGVSFYEMLTGKLPFGTDNEGLYAIMDSIIKKDIPDPREIYPYITSETVMMLRKMTAKNREERYSDFDSLMADIRQILSSLPELTGSFPPAGFPSVPSSEEGNAQDRETGLKSDEPLRDKAAQADGEKNEISEDKPQSGSREINTGEKKSFEPLLIYKREPEGLRIEFAEVEGGKFLMGNDGRFDQTVKKLFKNVKVTEGLQNEKPAHEVKVKSFLVSRYPVTVKQYLEFCRETGHPVPPEPPWGFHGDQPVVNVSYKDAELFCRWSSTRLLTEAEWEYSAGGGAKSAGYKFSGSNKLDECGWYLKNSRGTVKGVGLLKPNELGLFDMSGNIWEWCADYYAESYYAFSPPENPQGPVEGVYRVLRGGSAFSNEDFCRIFARDSALPGHFYQTIGFRVAKDIT